MRSLAGIVLLDLTHMLAGPYGTMLLTDLGCRTIKVEPPGAGEGTRQLLRDDPNNSRQGMGAYYLSLNRGKESVALDLKSEEGMPGNPIKLSQSRAGPPSAPPDLGEQTDAVLRGLLRYDAERIQGLRARAAIG